MRNILYIALAVVTFTACNSNKQETAEQPAADAVTDLQRDGLHGRVKKYIHQEYNAMQQGNEWQQSDTLQVHTEYNYDTAGMLQRAADLVVNGQQASATREYKHLPGKPLGIVSYDMTRIISQGTRIWNDAQHYTEKTFFNLNKEDTSNWQILQQVTLNSYHLPEKFTSTMRHTKNDTTYVNTAWLYYDADNHVSRKVLYNGTDSVIINYTILQKDNKGNPTKTLKQYPQKNEAMLLTDTYEYYK